jgi:hypothetical protein
MVTKSHTKIIPHLLTALLAGSLLLSACAQAVTPTPPPEPTLISAPTSAPTAAPTAEPTAPAEPTALPTPDGTLHVTLDTAGLAAGFVTEAVPAVSDDGEAPYWKVLPAYTRLILADYAVGMHSAQPQLFIYPVAELLQANEGAAKVVASLQGLLQSPQEIAEMPFLPLTNNVQAMHANIQYLDFKNGQGLRYLTQLNQGIVPFNNAGLIYTYQGLTADGKYYVAAVLPLNHPSLPADAAITGNEPLEFSADFAAYKANVVNTLNTAAPGTFTPDLTRLDGMLSSLEIK